MTTSNVESEVREVVREDDLERQFEERSRLYKTLAMGVSFSAQNIHFAEIGKEPSGFLVRKYGTIATTMKFGSGIEGVEKNIRDLNSYLTGCLEDNGIQARRLNLSLNTHLVSLQRVTADAAFSEEEFENYVNWEFRQHVLDGADQYVINSCELSSGEASHEILLVGVRRRFVDTLKQTLEKSKIDLTCMDVDVLCAHAAYEVNYDPLPGGGLTALAEVKPGVMTILLCRDYDVKFVYQFPVSAKSNPGKVGFLLNQNLDYLMDDYLDESGVQARIGRTLLCNVLGPSVLPHVDKRFNPSLIEPLRKIRLSEDYLVAAPKSDESGDAPAARVLPATDFSPYAECFGAAVKLLVEA
jgi:hypothetical protein